MKKVAILAINGAMADSVVGPMQVFSQAGVTWNYIFGNTPTQYFDACIVTMDGKPITSFNNLVIQPHCSAQDITDVDLIIVGSFCDVYSAINTNRDAIAWLKRRYDKGSTIASVCLGAFLLSETGLLNGKSATTHWGFAKQFCQMYPKVRLKPEKMITDEGELLCSGACTSYMDLSLYLVDRYCGYPVAVECAKSMIHEFDRRSQNAYIGYVFHKEHNDNEIWRVQKWIETNYVATTDFDSLSKKHGMSRRTFERRFREATGTTPTGYLQHTRIEHAKSLLENTHQTFDQITDAVGYKDSSFFRKVFIKHTGLRPKKYQSKFGKK